jgi:hypothetical protein
VQLEIGMDSIRIGTLAKRAGAVSAITNFLRQRGK